MWWNKNQIFTSLSVLMNKLDYPNGLYIFICEKFLKIVGNRLRYSADHVHIRIQSFSTTNLNTKIRIQIIKIMTEVKIIIKMTSFIPQDWSGPGLSSVSHYISMLTVSMSFEQSFCKRPYDRSLSSISEVFLWLFTLKPSGIKDVTSVLTCVNHELSMMITFV